MADFSTGQQPCQNYQPQDALFTGSGNVHQCYAPFDRKGPRCAESHGGLVSFCENCGRDHHSGGYETCAGRQPLHPVPAPAEHEAVVDEAKPWE